MGIGAEGKKRKRKKNLPEVDLRVAKASTVALSGPDLDREGVDGLPAEHSFHLKFVDRRGRSWTGSFKSHVLTTREKVQLGLIRAQLAGNTPFEALDPITYNLLEMVAVLSVALDSNPTWADDLLDLHDSGVLQAIYEEVVSYEARFHGTVSAGAAQGDGEEPEVDAGAGAPGSDWEAE